MPVETGITMSLYLDSFTPKIFWYMPHWYTTFENVKEVRIETVFSAKTGESADNIITVSSSSGSPE